MVGRISLGELVGLVGWLVGWLVAWVGWCFVGWFVVLGFLFVCLLAVRWVLVDACLLASLVVWMVGWLIPWLVGCLMLSSVLSCRAVSLFLRAIFVPEIGKITSALVNSVLTKIQVPLLQPVKLPEFHV